MCNVQEDELTAIYVVIKNTHASAISIIINIVDANE
jgi:hypothetical protein|tara:strand:+ start:319 stop:426 length:108 start_codon:yes stop_codon:yes gene_type:complete